MSSFYAVQAKGYDAVHENMLVARPEVMSSFGPIKLGGHGLTLEVELDGTSITSEQNWTSSIASWY